MFRVAVLVCALVGPAGVPLDAQSTSTPGAALGALPPAPPDVAATDAEGQITLRATRITEPLRIDGKMDEPSYGQVKPIIGFRQMQPDYGAPASGETEVWILYDDTNFYVTCRCGNGPTPVTLDDMRRDLANRGSDYLSFAIDTFRDRRSSFLFYVTPIGGLSDSLITDETLRNDSWNGVWDAKATQYDGGWIGEVAIPFKTLRYRPGRDQVWGILMRRRIPGNGDEHSFLPLVPQAWGIGAGRMSKAATLTGLQVPSPSLNFEIKPYATADIRTDVQALPPISNDPGKSVGFDLKYGITKGLTLDATYNTDFAQVEADQTQVNLTRFSLFFPEKRDFFLEGQGLFAFGGANTGSTNPNAADVGSSVVPIMFFSRQIGLNQGRAVPIIAGGRLTGRVDRYSVGALSITTDEDQAGGVPPTNFDVMRVKRDLFRQSSVGALVTHRSVSLAGRGSNQLYGIDGAFTFFENLHLNAYTAKTETPGRLGHDLSYRAMMNYDGDRYGLQVDRLVVDQNFNPEVGFMQRQAFRQMLVTPRFTPRPRGRGRVRQYNYVPTVNYITDNQNQLQSRTLEALYRIEFRTSDTFTAQYDSNYERVVRPFAISEGVTIPAGAYDFSNVRVAYILGLYRRVSGTAAVEQGSFYSGTKTSAAFNGRVRLGYRLSVEPVVSYNWIELPPQQNVITKVISARTNYSFTPRMYFSGLLQYNSTSSSFSANLRYRWEYRPGSDFFVVYTEGRDTYPDRGFPLENRGVAVKLTRLVRF